MTEGQCSWCKGRGSTLIPAQAHTDRHPKVVLCPECRGSGICCPGFDVERPVGSVPVVSHSPGCRWNA
jgi:hypothetical protein